MNKAKQTKLLESVPRNGQHVFEAIPAREAWAIPRIVQELQRLGHNIEHRILQGCIARLVDAGLVKEIGHETYQRKPVSGSQAPRTLKLATPPTPPEEPMAKPTEKPAGERSALNRLIVSLESIGAALEEAEAAALDVAEEIERLKKQTEKGRKLRELLNELQQDD